jgi:hypothetical protein
MNCSYYLGVWKIVLLLLFSCCWVQEFEERNGLGCSATSGAGYRRRSDIDMEWAKNEKAISEAGHGGAGAANKQKTGKRGKWEDSQERIKG